MLQLFFLVTPTISLKFPMNLEFETEKIKISKNQKRYCRESPTTKKKMKSFLNVKNQILRYVGLLRLS